jgi:hypothetical protein
LVKTGVIEEYDNKEGKSLAEIQASKETLWELTPMQTISYLNGQLFGKYIVFIKKHMNRCWNQIWSIKVSVIKQLEFGISEECRGGNWNMINAELDVRKLLPLLPVCYSFVSMFRKYQSPSRRLVCSNSDRASKLRLMPFSLESSVTARLLQTKTSSTSTRLKMKTNTLTTTTPPHTMNCPV